MVQLHQFDHTGRGYVEKSFALLNEVTGLIVASVSGVRDFPSMDDTETPSSTRKVRPKQYDQNTESIFILPALELHFQTRQLDGENSSSSIHRSS